MVKLAGLLAYDMTNKPYSDSARQDAGKTPLLPFASSEIERAGLRVTRAQFSRLMSCSKQAVTDWVKSGRIILGADSRFDPTAAVEQLLRTGDPARLRAKILAPLVRDIAGRDRRIAELEAALVRDIAGRDRRIAELEAALGDLKEDAEFNKSAADGLLNLFDALQHTLESEWSKLINMVPPERGRAVLLACLDEALEQGIEPGGFFDLDEMAARIEEEEEGEGPDSFLEDEEGDDE
jgi:hypothetical protein